jgi:predicted permease
MTHLLADLRYAIRTLRKSPIFTVVAVLSIALGLGANTAIFTLVDQALLRLLPVKDPEQLVMLYPTGYNWGNWQGDNYVISYPIYTDLRDHNDVFSGMFVRRAWPMQVSYQGRTERIGGELVSGTYFSVLGVGAALGRVLTPEDDQQPGAHPVAVLGYNYWRTRFGADPSVIGQKIIVNNYPLTIIGVSQQGFDGVDMSSVPDIRVPMMMAGQVTPIPGAGGPGAISRLENRRLKWVHIFGRMKPGLTVAEVKARLQPFYHSILDMELKQPAFNPASAETRQKFLTGQLEVLEGSQGRPSYQRSLARSLWVLTAIVVGLLLIACANVANLLLARASARQREVALRLALGATRTRIVQQLLIESLVLAIAGSALGLIIAVWGANLLLSFIVASDQSSVLSAAPDARIVAFNFAVALITGLLFGLAPALQSTRTELAPTLKAGAGSVLGGGQVRLRKGLVVVQVALSLLLLIGAGLFVRSLRNLLTLDTGFKTSNLVTFSIDPRLNGYTLARMKDLYRALPQRLATIPGVESVSLAQQAILDGSQWAQSVTVEGYQFKPDEVNTQWMNAVTPGFFATMGIPILAGHDFLATDERTRTPEERTPGTDGYRKAIVNESFVKQYFGEANPIGRRMGIGGTAGTPTPIEIVGVVKDTKYTGIRADKPRQVFFPALEADNMGGMAAYIRASAAPETIFNQVRQTMSQIDPNLPIFAMRTLDEQVNRSLSNERLMASLSGIFSTLATLLAMIGLYGVMAYTVSRRTREIGIRMALGAIAGNIAWLVMREVLVLVAIGMVIAGPIVWMVSTYVQSQLYGITPADPITLVAASLGLAAVAGLAGLIPALRAARVNPITALRYE